jgi:hypothetical protein|eukprot:jgi/Chrpa1/897/Chrysochromulina_OHIO_Genome00007173-RA
MLFLFLSLASCASLDRDALIELGTACSSKYWVRHRNWLSAEHHICDWELVGCDLDGRVKILALDFNNLTGTLPSSVGLLSKLEDLDLEHNHLVGSVPSELGQLSSLVQLGLGGNQFSGRIPDEACAPLQRIVSGGGKGQPACDLSGNKFACPLPACNTTVATCGGACASV